MENKKKDIFKDGFSSEIKNIDNDKVANIEPNKRKNFLENINNESTESFKEEEFSYHKNQKFNIKNYIIQYVIIGMIVASIFFFTNQKVEVIDFTNMTFNDAVAWGNENNLIITKKNVYSNDIDENIIISQNIEAGVKVKNDTNITLDVSMGLDPYEIISIPNFDSSWSKSSIQNWLQQNGIENYVFTNIENNNVNSNFLISYKLVGATEDDFMRSSEIHFTISNSNETETVTVSEFLNSTLVDVDRWAQNNNVEYTYTFKHSNIYAKDKIMYQSVSSGNEMFISDTLVFIVSLGTPEDIIMDNFINRTLIEADSWAQNNGIKYTYTYQYSSLYGKDMIMTQSVSAGEEIGNNTTVRFIISKGQEVTIPSFSNIRKSEAENYNDLPITVLINEIYQDGTNYGDFISQSIPKDTKVEEGSNITLNYSLGDTVVVTNFTNQLKSDIEQWIREINTLGANITLVVNEEFNSSVEVGKIISQNIYNQDLKVGSSITILISLGDSYEVQDLSTLTRNEIEDHFNNEGLTVIFEEIDSEELSGTFLNQYPAVGETISKTTFITVQIAK